MSASNNNLKLGLISAVLAHVLWGVFPLFWRQLGHVNALEVVCHRVLWAFVILLLALPLLVATLDKRSRANAWSAFRSFRHWRSTALAACLVAINWLTFIWAVNHDRVLEASLGYYINPLLNVVLGVLVIGERLSKYQWLAVMVATIGVGVMTVAEGGLPWVSLILACSFATYGLVKKQTSTPALIGLLFENAALLLPSLAYVAYVESTAGGVFAESDPWTITLLVLGGSITIAPLALFAYAAQRVPLSTIGILQYIGPSMQFLIGTLILHERFDRWRLIGFGFVWLGLAIYLVNSRKRNGPPA